MDQEMFIADGGLHMPAWSKSVNVDTPNLEKVTQVAITKCCHSVKLFVRVALVLMLVWLLLQIPAVMAQVKTFMKKGFTQKEGLQWLGASTDVVRGDYENNQDSLAEKAFKRDTSVTDMNAPVKATFMMREKMTPEEEALKKMNQ